MTHSPIRSLSAATACLIGWVVPGVAQVNYQVLHEFERPGAQPLAPLLLHTDGNFYGTTVGGGACGHGAVFRLSPVGVMETVISFSGASGPVPGGAPTGPLAEGPDGELYGTTTTGGANGFGLTFKLTTSGTYTKLTDFTGPTGLAKGAVPCGLVAHADGNFYGTTEAGGANGFGTVFQMTPAGTITTLLEFTGTGGSHPGSRPVGPLAVMDTALYGVTREGGANSAGTAYEVTTGGVYRSLATFNGTNGSRPSALLAHSNGTLYGSAEFGGTFGFGTAFSLSTGATPDLTVLYHFDDPDGSQPVGRLTELSNGNLAGVASLGGSEGWGSVFEMTTAGSYTLLASFTGENGAIPGAEPLAGLTNNGSDSLFGLTSAGGPANLGTVFRIDPARNANSLANFSLPTGWFPSGAPHPDSANGFYFPVAAGGDNGGGAILHLLPDAPPTVATPLGGALGSTPTGGLKQAESDFFGVTATGGSQGRGTAFKFNPNTGGSLTAAYRSANGSRAEGPLVTGEADNTFLGVAREGGSSGQGSVYRITSGGTLTRLVSFTGTGGSAPGRTPRGPLARAPDGNFYGVTEMGGAHNAGVIFKVSPNGTYTLLHEFLPTEPRTPRGGLITGPGLSILGTTSLGGANDLGAVIRINPSNDSWSQVASFSSLTGSAPAGPLVTAADGTLFGLTTGGGPAGHGGLFRLSPTGSLEALVTFTGETGAFPGRGQAVDGPFRFLGGLTFGSDGLLYGVTPAGGAKGGGVAFRLLLESSLADWKETNLGNHDAPDLGDPDRDGLPTLAEYALLLLPQIQDAAGAPRAETAAYPDGARLRVLVPRDSSRADVNVYVEVSSDLQNPWTLLASSIAGQPFSGPGYVAGDSGNPGIKTVEIRDIVPNSATSQRFIRIRVTRNTP